MSNFLIETKQLTKVYGEQTAVNSVNLHVGKGRIYRLLGRNGAGKTTIMKQRLGIANAIVHDPELLILDEPTNGLDPIGIVEMHDFIKNLSVQHGKTVLMSSHILSEISLLAYVVVRSYYAVFRNVIF